MEWILISASILVAAYFIYAAIQRKNDIEEKRFKLESKEDAESLSNVRSNLENDIIDAKFKLEEANKAGNKDEIKKAKEWLKYKQSEILKYSLAGLAVRQAIKNNEK